MKKSDGSPPPPKERRSDRLAALQAERAAAAMATARHLSSLDGDTHSEPTLGNTRESDRDASGSKAGACASEQKSGADASTGQPSAGLSSHVARGDHSDTQEKSDSSWQALSELDRDAASSVPGNLAATHKAALNFNLIRTNGTIHNYI